MIRVLIPIFAMFVAVFLYFRRPTAYVSYTLWVWFLSPLVRRLVDWKLGYQDQNLILIAPHLVSSVAILSILVSSKKKPSISQPVFILCGAAVLYGFVIGMLLHPSAEGAFGLINWMAPLLFGMYIARDWENYEVNKAVLLKTFLWATGVMGVYGIYQFFVAPAWDTFWLQNISLTLVDPSFGQPEPMLIRVWSTLNAPGPFAGIMMTALLLLTASSSPLKIPFAISGYISFLLSAVRAAWLGWGIGLVLILRRSNPKVLVRFLLSMAVLAACIIPIVQNPEMAPGIGDRLKSLTELKQDASLREREDMYRVVTGVILHQPFGTGLSNQTIVRNLAVDSGILITLLSLGWLGTVLYLGGVMLFIFRSGGAGSNDNFIFACRAICFSGLVQYVGANPFYAISGAMFWLCAGSAIAGTQWHRATALDSVSAEEQVAASDHEATFQSVAALPGSY